jgi:hypothetical protein
VALAWLVATACAPVTPEVRPAIGYGAVMADVARRFELLGRAASGGRLELAAYQLGAIEEQFTQTLPRAAPPGEGHPEVLPALAGAFVQRTVPDLRRALAAREPARFNDAFARAAGACNACHQASGHGFIVVPATPGRAVPEVDPLPPVSP